MADPLIGMSISFEVAPPPKHDAPRGGLGSQVLPVADLEADWEGAPEDGSQYLALVRREVATYSAVLRVNNPYEVAVAAIPSQGESAPSSRPSEAWREIFVRNFEETRKRMQAAPIHSLPPVDPAHFPSPRDEGAWRVFINGKKAKAVRPASNGAAVAVKAVAVKKEEVPVQVQVQVEAPAEEDAEMTNLEAAKAAVLASLDLDAPEPEALPPPPPPPARKPAPTPVSAPSLSSTPPQTPEYERLPQLPSPALVVAIPNPSIIHILSHFNDWFTERQDAYEEVLNFVPSTIFAPTSIRRKPAASSRASTPAPAATTKPTLAAKKAAAKPPLPTAHESHWLLSLLTRLDLLLDGEDLANLRQLAKTLAQLAEGSAKKSGVLASTVGGRTMQQRLEAEEEAEGRARCWMIVAAIAGVWAQGDLWDSTL